MDRERRFYLGIFFAAILPSLAFAATSPGLGADFSVPSSIGVLALVLYLPSVAFTAAFAIPTFHVMRRFNFIRWWSVSLTGLLCGALAESVFTGFRWSNPEWFSQDFPALRLWSLVGLGAALIVWVFWATSSAQQGIQPDGPASGGSAS